MISPTSYILINKIFLILISIATISIASWIIFANPKSKINQSFSLMTITFLLWWTGGYFFSFSENKNTALLLGRLILAIVPLSFATMYHFLEIFPKENYHRHKTNKILYILSITFASLPLIGNIIVKNISKNSWGNSPTYGPLGLLYYAWLAFFMVIIFALLIKRYREIHSDTKIKFRYVFIGFMVFIWANLIFNVCLPLLTGTIKYWQIGNYSSLFLIGLTAYAIISKQLFGIKVILTQTLTGTIILILLWQTITVTTSQNWIDLIWKIILLIFICILSVILIRSVKKEIKQRQKIERLSKLRSKISTLSSTTLLPPLSNIKNLSQMIKDENLGKISQEMRSAIETILENSDTIEEAVRGMAEIDHK